MNLKHLWNEGKPWVARGLEAVEVRVKTWTQPASDRPIKGVVTDLFRGRKDLVAENAFLRQQVIILNLCRLLKSSVRDSSLKQPIGSRDAVLLKWECAEVETAAERLLVESWMELVSAR
ncbi:MAG: hypothetical protein JW963_05820 [Anaerolineales bacterium]|nr:hypothetical protein [Anaerolineales bacterium]